MNNLNLPCPLWIASDIHLGPDGPATRQAFSRFLEQARDNAGALLLCGDIFEAWIGDDQALKAPPGWLAQIIDELEQTGRKLPVFLGRGNRDFLLGQAFASRVGAHVLGDATRVSCAGITALVSHGDEYCTDDASYQRFRHWVRKPWVQALYLALGLGVRQRIARWARHRSRQSTAEKTMRVLDVNNQAIIAAFKRAGVSVMIHGHTHRPATHTYMIEGRTCTRYVLPDWDFDAPNALRGGWLVVDTNGVHPIQASNSSCN